MRESRLQSKIISYLKANGIYYVNTYGSGMTAKGVPDLLICLNGKFIAFECKVDNNGMQPDQKIHEIRITRSNGKHYCPCGNFCAVKNMNKILDGEIVSIFDE